MSQIDPIALDLLYRRSLRPTWRTWMKHILLLLVTFVTMTIAGTLWPFGLIPYLPDADPQNFNEFLKLIQGIPAGLLPRCFGCRSSNTGPTRFISTMV